MQYAILVEHKNYGMLWEYETDNFTLAYTKYQKIKQTERAMLVHVLVDSLEEAASANVATEEPHER